MHSETLARVSVWARRAAAAMALGLAIYFVGAFMFVVASRITYPYALEWLEGGSYAQVQRLLTGQSLYARPSVEYVAMIYPPLYYFSAALVARVIGLTYIPLRLISVAATLGSIAAIFLTIRLEGNRAFAASLGAGLFAAAYRLSGSWFDIGRVDMLAVFLALLAIFLFRHARKVWHVAAGVVFALACFTKQVHLITFACIAIYAALFDRKKLLTFVAPSVLVLVSLYMALNSIYGGWMGFYVLKLALGSSEYVTFDPTLFVHTATNFWLGSMALALPIPLLALLAYILLRLPQSQDQASLYFYLACMVGMVGTSWAVVQVGGYKNDLMPAYSGISLLFGMAIQALLERTSGKPWLGTGLLGLCIAQFALLWYPLGAQVPSRQDLAAGESLVQRIQAQPGDVYLPFHPDLALMANKRPFASWSAVFQLEGNYGGGDIRRAGLLKTEFSRAMERRQFSMIILDQEPDWIWGDPERFYTRSPQPVFEDKLVFWPVVGWQTRPEIVLFPVADGLTGFHLEASRH